MPAKPIAPTTLDGIKRRAKRIKCEAGITHTAALEQSAQAAGYQSFQHARRVLASAAAPHGSQS